PVLGVYGERGGTIAKVAGVVGGDGRRDIWDGDRESGDPERMDVARLAVGRFEKLQRERSAAGQAHGAAGAVGRGRVSVGEHLVAEHGLIPADGPGHVPHPQGDVRERRGGDERRGHLASLPASRWACHAMWSAMNVETKK